MLLFLAGRPFISSEVENHFLNVDSISVSLTKKYREGFLRITLDRDAEPDAMDGSCRAHIMEIIPKIIFEMYI